jgi:hypothetical protein
VVACVRCDRAGRSRLAKLIASMGPGFQEHRGGRKNSEEQEIRVRELGRLPQRGRPLTRDRVRVASRQTEEKRQHPSAGAPRPDQRDTATGAAPVARLPDGCHAQLPPQKSASRAAAAVAGAGRAASTILEGGKRLNVPKTRMDFSGLGMRCPEKPSIRIERFLPRILPPVEADILQDDTDEQSQ